MSNDERIPSDQFDRVIEEMRKFANMIDEQERHMSTARGINMIEARRCFALSSTRLQEAGYWFQQALTHARTGDGKGRLQQHKPGKSIEE
jgi:hypothetical protein